MTPLPETQAFALLALTLAAAWLADRALRRRERTRRREREADLAAGFAAWLRGDQGGGALASRAAGCDGGTFWTALESLTLAARDRRRLARVLASNPHVEAECRSLADDSPWRRELAARRLALLPAAGTRRALHEALRSGPEVVTHAAALALARQRELSALEWLLGHPGALARRTPRARTGLYRAFGRRAHPLLLRSLESSAADPATRQAAVETLGLARACAARPAIERQLGATELEVRVAAARALGRIGQPDSVAALVRALHDSEWPVRAQAAWALGRLREPAALEALPARLADPAFWVRRHAAHALAALGEPGREVLRHVAAGSPDPYARDASREALERSA